MKKIFSILLVTTMIFGLIGCSGSKTEEIPVTIDTENFISNYNAAADKLGAKTFSQEDTSEMTLNTAEGTEVVAGAFVVNQTFTGGVLMVEPTRVWMTGKIDETEIQDLILEYSALIMAVDEKMTAKDAEDLLDRIVDGALNSEYLSSNETIGNFNYEFSSTESRILSFIITPKK